MIGQRVSARKRMIPGSRGKRTEWMRRRDAIPPGWMLREGKGEESEILVAQGLNYAKIGPFFIHRPQCFLGTCAAGWQIHFHINCKVKNISLYDCIDLYCLLAVKKVWKDGDVSHSHISKSHILWDNTSAG